MKTTIHLCAWALACVLARSALAAQEAPPAGARVLVLDNEHLMEGDIVRRGDQYVIRGAGGEVMVPVDKTLTVCGSLQDAFKFLSNRANQRDPAERLRLARWCLAHELRDQAVLEAKAALFLRPGYVEAQQLLAMLEHAAAPVAAPLPANLARAAIDPAPLEIQGGGLALFSTKVQTILMNTCASCHATGHGGTFVLTRPTDVSVQRALQLNLSAVVQQISFDQPTASPLLLKACSAHGGAVQPALTNRQALPYITLENWVQQVVAHYPQLKPEKVGSGQGVVGSAKKLQSAEVEGTKSLVLSSTSENGQLPTETAGPASARPVEITPSTVQGPGSANTPNARAVQMWANTTQVPGASLAAVSMARSVEIHPSTSPPPPPSAPGGPRVLVNGQPATAFLPPPSNAPGTPRPIPLPQTLPEDLSGPYDPRLFNEMVYPQR